LLCIFQSSIYETFPHQSHLVRSLSVPPATWISSNPPFPQFLVGLQVATTLASRDTSSKCDPCRVRSILYKPRRFRGAGQDSGPSYPYPGVVMSCGAFYRPLHPPIELSQCWRRRRCDRCIRVSCAVHRSIPVRNCPPSRSLPNCPTAVLDPEVV